MIRMAQYGTKHGHAEGKLGAMLKNPHVEVVGVYEPDMERRHQLASREGPYREVRWFSDAQEMLSDGSILAVASEGRNDESLSQTETIVEAGRHVWYDKPAGDNWPQWQRVIGLAQQRGLHIQMGYMFRYHDGFKRIADWAKDGLLDGIYAIRAHMSTHISAEARRVISVHRGGISFDLSGHMLDQIVWILGRPLKVTSFLRHDDSVVPGFEDNTLVVHEYARAMSMIDIAAMEVSPTARRYEVYGTRGTAILMEPFEPAQTISLSLDEDRGGYKKGRQIVPVTPQSRQSLYELELEAFLATINGQQAPDRSFEHELLVQETLLRGMGILPSE
jgi:predicted dehydrogenase